MRDAAGQVLPDAKMFGLPGDHIALLTQPGLSAGNNTLFGMCQGIQVHIHTSGEVKADTNRGLNQGDKSDLCHCPGSETERSGFVLTPDVPHNNKPVPTMIETSAILNTPV